ncbi:hypothetical protein RF11_06924 [Thelohanellus kitauei]|uniref:Uncharacterized protein n=1 Tax=Thelohanellus kitauei TaxID=669202 RepID=A0A0C2MMN0_THEKT|nr:hypothetical protein RF11_06924 [Thelohanellus kitauei]
MDDQIERDTTEIVKTEEAHHDPVENETNIESEGEGFCLLSAIKESKDSASVSDETNNQKEQILAPSNTTNHENNSPNFPKIITQSPHEDSSITNHQMFTFVGVSITAVTIVSGSIMLVYTRFYLRFGF